MAQTKSRYVGSDGRGGKIEMEDLDPLMNNGRDSSPMHMFGSGSDKSKLHLHLFLFFLAACVKGVGATCGAGFIQVSGVCVTCPIGHYCVGGSAGAELCWAGYSCPFELCDSWLVVGRRGRSMRRWKVLTPWCCFLYEAGKFNENVQQELCTNCGTGRYSTTTGNVIESNCRNCEAGTASSEEVRTTPCPACPEGKSAPAPGLKVCVGCSAGTYSNSTGETSCTKCTAGRYSRMVESTSCQECDSGTFNLNEGSVGCDKCAGAASLARPELSMME
ncbi:hypothetical protein TrRE_jg595 [Triparma retinervis]|uniref:Tyrosine-protein kinase ephrin type A/B receptor-like domain-containing protein n=1 Tax=Triparma retinervis TaxID=2557542 RepID=A0A9W7A4R8_9STRA|nr:hypothetical protein TrRE_jg595 [Triparma retinervis]